MKKYIALIVIGLCFYSVVASAEDTTANQVKTNREATIASIKEKVSALKTQMETIKKEAIAKNQAEMTKLKAKLTKIKDEKKKTTVENIATKLSQINAQSTEHFTAVVNQMEKVLTNIKSRTDKAAAKNLDVTAIRAQITIAESSIASARVAINTQALKVYNSNITTETTLKEVMKTSRDLLQKDITTLKATVKSTRDEVQKAATELAKIPKVDEVTNGIKVETTNN